MKKANCILCVTLLLFCVPSYSQLRSYVYGNVSIGRDSAYRYSRLTVSEISAIMTPAFQDGTRKTGIASYTYPNKSYNYGILGSCTRSSAYSSGRSFGVYGTAGNCTSGYNYGVYGYLTGTANGSAVYGSVASNNGSYVPGQYAAYFQGDAYITGTATINNLYTPSDVRLKDDIEYVAAGDIHSLMMDVNVISYKLKAIPEVYGMDGEAAEPAVADRRTRYGVSAQELQELFPDLVGEGQDGYLAVNYLELVPMLICSVQQLQKEVDELRGMSAAGQSPARGNVSGIENALAGDCMLYQNTPNPASSSTTIRYSLPPTAKTAQILLLNLQGTLLKKYPVAPNQNSLTVSLDGIGEGIYLYTLVVDGKEMYTRRMIVSK